jgi:hypothetical protein
VGNQNVTSAGIIKQATETREGSYGGKSELVRPEFRDALMAVAGRGGALNGRALGNWLESQKDRIIDGLQFVRMGERQGVAVWALREENTNG